MAAEEKEVTLDDLRKKIRREYKGFLAAVGGAEDNKRNRKGFGVIYGTALANDPEITEEAAKIFAGLLLEFVEEEIV